MWRRVRDWRRVGWLVLGFAAVLLSLGIAVGAFGADTESFDRWVGWANILAAVCAALGFLLVVRPPRPPLARTPEDLADALTRQVLDHEGRVLSNLLNTGHDPGRAAPLVFYEADGTRGDLDGVADFYQAHTVRRLVVLGAPGAGKTVLLLRLMCDLAKARDALGEQERSRTPAPLRFDLAGWDTSLELEDWLADTMAARFDGLTRDQAMTLLKQRLVLPILDGLDEMDMSA